MPRRPREEAIPRTRKTPPGFRYAPWRVASLILVHLLIAAHIAHWLIADKTLAPLEFNEVMYTFELGIITAGFIFMALAVLATAIFGRFFCSWGCHILALQDLSAWMLGKLRIRPVGIRSRLLLWTPLVVAIYMFVWPQVERLWEGESAPILHLRSDAQGWASFTTQQFWRNLPGPGVAMTTFAVCGFAIVYVLGSRSFCAYGCPYGAVFGLVDRIAPGKIRAGADCTRCGACTAACSSHIRVHEELNRYGMVVDPACMKDLDCVSACPRQSVHYGFGRPALTKRMVRDTAIRKRHDFTLTEEGIMAAVLICALVIYRGLYDLIPFLLSIALGTILAYFAVIAVRLLRHPNVKLNRWPLKQGGRLSSKGCCFVVAAVLLGLLTLHSAVVRYDTLRGRRYYARSATPKPGAQSAVGCAVRHLERADRIGWLTPVRVDAMLADLYLRQGRWSDASYRVGRVLASGSGDARLYNNLAVALARHKRFDEAEHLYQTSLTASGDDAHTHYALAGVYFSTNRVREAMHSLGRALDRDPRYADAHYDLGAILVERGALEEGVAHLRQAIEIRPDFADAHYNLAVALAMMNRIAEAAEAIEIARKLNPGDENTVLLQRHLAELRSQNETRRAPAAGTGN